MKKINKGQNLLEFTLVAPILILVLVVISELGYAFVVRHAIIDCIKQTVQSSQFLVGKYATQQEMLDAMKADLLTVIADHNLPPAEDVTFGIAESNQYGTAVIITYTYRPGIRLIGITPEQISIPSIQVLHSGLLKINSPTVPSEPYI